MSFTAWQLRNQFAESRQPSVGWIQPPLRDRVFAAAFLKQNFGYDDSGVCDQDRAYDEWLNAELTPPTPPKVKLKRRKHKRGGVGGLRCDIYDLR